MRDNGHPVDEAMRWVARGPELDDAAVGRVRARLETVFDLQPASPQPRTRTLVWSTGLALVLVAVFVAIQVASPSPLIATIEDVASVVETLDPLTIAPQQYLHTTTRTTSLIAVQRDGLGGVQYDRDIFVYQLTTLRETYIGAAGATQIQTTNLTPSFYSAGDEAIYYAADLDETDALGETIVESVTTPPEHTWPNEPDLLDQAIRRAAADRGLPDTVEYLDTALDILREPTTPPELRANSLRLIADLPYLQLVTAGGVETEFAIDYDDQGISARLQFTIDQAGFLVGEHWTILEPDARYGLSRPATVTSVTYTPPRVVDQLP